MGNKTSQEKGLDGSKLKVGSCYKNSKDDFESPNEYQGKLLKKSKNNNGSWHLVFEGNSEYVGVPPENKPFVKCKCRKVFTERLTKQTRKRDLLQKEMKACVKAKCSAEQAAVTTAEKKFNKTVKQQCKGLSKANNWNSDWNKCKQEINKKDRTGGTRLRNLYACKMKKCKDIGDTIKKTYYG